MEIILTGATGFLGSHLLKRLLDDGHKVSIIKRSFSSIDKIRSVLNNDNLSVYDIDSCALEYIFQQKKIDIIIHAATEYGRNDESIHKILEANVILPVKLIEMGIKYNVKSFLNTDSYFNKENYRYSNLLNYSLSKRSLLTWLKQLSSNIQIMNVSLEHIYGPNDSDSKFVEMLFKKIAIEKVDRVSLTHGHQKRDFIFVDDVVQAYIALIKYSNEHNFSYRNFEIGTGECIEVRELAVKIKRLSNSSTILGFGDIPYRSDEIMQSKADLKQMTELNWWSSTSLDDGVQNILEAYGCISK
ncbi:NAD-dependent epimerase/dehydratase family protein [Polynucleobacter paneuropaeus]|nr:NAD-dependent epimerase/dehydratase family protein [Polynucleobacter paneuropaeus]